MQFQKTRDPERVEVELRAAVHAAAGYPPPVHDRALDEESIIQSAKLARALAPCKGDSSSSPD